MPGITTIHHSLRDVDSGTRYVGATTYVHQAADQSAVHPHPQLELRVFPRGTTDLQRAFNRRFRSVVENQRHPIDRKSTRLNSSHMSISYAVFCLKKKKKEGTHRW